MYLFGKLLETRRYNIVRVSSSILCRPENKGETKDMVRKVVLVIALVVVVLSLVGCQTVQGVGRDITWIGEKGTEVLER